MKLVFYQKKGFTLGRERKMKKENLESLIEAKHRLIHIWIELEKSFKNDDIECQQILIDIINLINVVINKYLPLPENKA